MPKAVERTFAMGWVQDRRHGRRREAESSITVTLDRYGHLFPGLDERIADGLDDVLRGSLAVTPRSAHGHEVVELSG
jgi:hypothetical protein